MMSGTRLRDRPCGIHIPTLRPDSRACARMCSISWASCAGNCTTPGNARLRRQCRREFARRLEAQHVARGGLEQIGGAVQRHDAPGLEHGDAPAQGLGFFQVVRGQQNGVPCLFSLAMKCHSVWRNSTSTPAVGRPARSPGFVHQRLGHQHAALHAAGAGACWRPPCRPGPGFPAVRRSRPRCWYAKVAGLEAQCLAHIEEGSNTSSCGTMPSLRRAARTGLARRTQHGDATAGGARQARQDADQVVLPAPLGPSRPKNSPFLDIKPHGIERLERARTRATG